VPYLTLSDGERLHYEIQGEGPPLLLVSGLGGVASFWSDHVGNFAERFTVVTHDHRGTGQSSLSRIEYSVEQMAGDAIELMDGLGIGRTHYIGHSTGGAMGQVLAIDRPERIDRLVLSATWATADAYFHNLFEVRAATLREQGPGAYARLSALFMKPPRWVRDHAHRFEENLAAMARNPPDPAITLARIAAIRRFDRRADLGHITAPTLVIAAADDIVTPAYFSEELAKTIRGAKLALLPEGGHFFPNVVEAEFREIVTGFLEEGDYPPGALRAP
jgi:aminoacrylate hydrolase